MHQAEYKSSSSSFIISEVRSKQVVSRATTINLHQRSRKELYSTTALGYHNLWEHGSIAPGREKFSQEIFIDKKQIARGILKNLISEELNDHRLTNSPTRT